MLLFPLSDQNSEAERGCQLGGGHLGLRVGSGSQKCGPQPGAATLPPPAGPAQAGWTCRGTWETQ